MAKPLPDPYRVEVRAVKRGEAVTLTQGGVTTRTKTPSDGLYFEAYDPEHPRAFFVDARAAWEELDKLID